MNKLTPQQPLPNQVLDDLAGKKFDHGKLRMDLIPTEAYTALGEVLTYGISKGYDEEGWRRVESKRYLAAMLRHLSAHLSGEIVDQESEIAHTKHILCNALFYMVNENRTKE